MCSAPPQFSPVEGVQARRVGQIKSGAKRQHIKGWEDGRKRRLRCRGLGRDALRHSLRHRSAVSRTEFIWIVECRHGSGIVPCNRRWALAREWGDTHYPSVRVGRYLIYNCSSNEPSTTRRSPKFANGYPPESIRRPLDST